MQEKILFVDDEPQILGALKFSLGQKFNVSIAEGPEEGFRALEAEGPFAVVVSDLQMPAMNGGDFLEAVKVKSPDTVRLMLTSRADLESAIQVVNQANIFRFLTKPCATSMMVKCLYDALHQYRLVRAERELLEKTLHGSIRVMTEILSTVDPQSFDRAVALQKNVRVLAVALQLENVWQLEVAAMLAQVGCVTIPTSAISKARCGIGLEELEQAMFRRVPEVGRNLLNNIPRLEAVAQMVLYQNKNFDGSGFPADTVAGENIPLGARILKILIDLADLKTGGITSAMVFEVMRQRSGCYDLHLLESACSCFAPPTEAAPPAAKYSFPVRVEELRLGQIVLVNVESLDGILLVSAGREVTETVLEKIVNFAALCGIKEPLLVESTIPKERF